MHAESLELMAQMLNREVDPDPVGIVLDVGSLDINGSYRGLVEGLGYQYMGLDIRAGKNVDKVVDYPYEWSLLDNSFEMVICGNMLHNVPEPLSLIKEMVRVLKPDGLLAMVTIWKMGINEHPKDYWRFTPDGLRYLMEQTHQLKYIDARIANDQDVIGSAFKQ